MGRAATNIREKLVETAIDLIWRSSYGAVSVDDICRAAGAKKGSFYYYFESKAGLALAALAEQFERSRPEFEAAFCATLSPMQRIERMAELAVQKQEMTLREYGRVCGCPFATLGSEVAGQEEAIRAKIDEIINIHIGDIERLVMDGMNAGQLPAGLDAKAKAREIHAYVMGQMMTARIVNSLEPLKDLKDGILSILGVRARTLETV